MASIEKDQTETYYINLVTLSSFRALPNSVLRLNFKCSTTPIAIRRNADIQIHEQVFHQSWRPRYFGYLLGNKFKIQCTLSLVGKSFSKLSPTKKNIRELQNSSPLSQKESSNPRTSQNQMMVVATRKRSIKIRTMGLL